MTNKARILKKILLLIICGIYISTFSLMAPLNVRAQGADDSPDITTQELIRRGIYYYDPGYKECTTVAGDTEKSEDTIYVLGDSITSGVEKNGVLAGKLTAKGYTDIKIDGGISRSISEKGSSDETGLQAIENNKNVIKNADSVVIQLGTNGGTTKKNINKMIDSIKEINEIVNIYWVNVGVTRNDLNRTQQDANRALENNAKQKGINRYTVIDWQKKIGNNDPDNLLEDKVHPNNKGAKVLSTLIANKASSTFLNPEDDKVTGVGNDKSIAAKVWAFLVSKGEISIIGIKVEGLGLSDAAAAGVMGNLERESGFIVERIPSHAGAGYGLAQWTGPRRTALETFAKNEGKSPANLGIQLKYFRKELNEGYKDTLDRLQNVSGSKSDDLKNATYIFHGSTARSGIPSPFGPGFERSNDTPDIIQERVNNAKKWLNKYGNGNVTIGENGICEEDGELSGELNGEFSLPLKMKFYKSNKEWFTKPHHDYPSADIPVGYGTKVYSMTSGTITSAPTGGGCGLGVSVKYNDKVRLVYCHGSDGGSVAKAKQGDKVEAGQLIMHVASTGNSSGPHLHLGIYYNDIDKCPQKLLVAIAEDKKIPSFSELPSSGCSY